MCNSYNHCDCTTTQHIYMFSRSYPTSQCPAYLAYTRHTTIPSDVDRSDSGPSIPHVPAQTVSQVLLFRSARQPILAGLPERLEIVPHPTYQLLRVPGTSQPLNHSIGFARPPQDIRRFALHGKPHYASITCRSSWPIMLDVSLQWTNA